MNVEDAVMMLQRHERARQGRLRAKLMLEIRRQENAEKIKVDNTDCLYSRSASFFNILSL